MIHTDQEPDGKDRFRKKMLKDRNTLLTAEESILAGRRIIERYLLLDAYRNAGLFLCYVSKDGELDTAYLLKQALSDGKTVAVPKVRTGIKDGSVMDFCRIRSLEELGRGHYGVPEPLTDEVLLPREAEMIVPGLCFDLAGVRIGYGGGYYDRYLERFCGEQIHKTALAFDFQIFHTLPAEETDIRFDCLVTERRYCLL